MAANLSPVLFLPGLLCDATLWRAQIDGLADMVAPAVADLTLDDSIADMARRALAAAPPQFALVALSMGGYVAFEIMRQAPRRVTRLALLASSAAPDSPTRVSERRGAIESLELGRFRGVTDRLLPQLVHSRHVLSPVAETVKQMAERVGGPAFIRQQRAILGRPDSRPDLAHIKVPTLVAVGQDDRLTPPAESQEIHRGIPGSTLHMFEKCGHLPALELPTETTALLRAWLN